MSFDHVAGAPDLLAMDAAQLHRLVYASLLPTIAQREGREAAERCLLRFKVLGGLGPAATADFLQELVLATPARGDRQHLRLDVAIDPLMGQMPDASPLPATQTALDALLRTDAPTAFCLPCNTAHWRMDHLHYDRRRVSFVSMVDATVHSVAHKVEPGATVGLLATRRTVELELYQQAFVTAGFDLVVPCQEMQEAVNVAIYGGMHAGREHAGVKGGDTGAATTALVQQAVDWLIEHHKVQAICLSCTELPLAFGPQRTGPDKGDARGLAIVNSTRSLAQRFLRECLLIQATELLARLRPTRRPPRPFNNSPNP